MHAVVDASVEMLDLTARNYVHAVAVADFFIISVIC